MLKIMISLPCFELTSDTIVDHQHNKYFTKKIVLVLLINEMMYCN